MRRFLEDLGVPHEKIIEESRSRDTIENAEYTAQICSQYGYKRPVLVTSAFHMQTISWSFEKAGMKFFRFRRTSEPGRTRYTDGRISCL